MHYLMMFFALYYNQSKHINNNYTDLKQHMHVKKWWTKRKSKIYTQLYIKDIQFTELNNHVGWTTEIIYVNKAGHVYITFHTGLGVSQAVKSLII